MMKPAEHIFGNPSQSTLSFECSLQDRQLIGKITQRVCEMGALNGVELDHITMAMDLVAVHCNGTPLKLLQLMMAGDDDFSKDVLGIGRNVDRRNGQLLNGFKPFFVETKQ